MKIMRRLRYFVSYSMRENRKRIILNATTLAFICVFLYTTRRHADKKHTFISYLKTFKETYSSSSSQKTESTSCPKQDIPVWSADVENFIEVPTPIHCEEKEWVYTKQGRFFISQEATKIYGEIKCIYTPYTVGQEEYKSLDPVEGFQSGSKLLSDVFHVSCTGDGGKRFERFYPCISENTVEPLKSYNKYNVFMFGIDSMSRLMFMRLLPKTVSYFTEELQGEVLEGYNILGEGTPRALFPILTGQQDTESTEIRRGHRGSVYVDEAYTFIWKKFEEKGYVTQWGEDEQKFATF